jgi:hypothetical protein
LAIAVFAAATAGEVTATKLLIGFGADCLSSISVAKRPFCDCCHIETAEDLLLAPPNLDGGTHVFSPKPYDPFVPHYPAL